MSTKKATQKSRTTSSSSELQEFKALAGHEASSATLRLYVKDKTLLKKAKVAAAEDEVSLSQLWEQWATEWLSSR